MAKRVDFALANEEIISRLDILAEYRALGVEFVSVAPRSSGMIECYARGRQENKPSAAVNVTTGRYIDSGSGESLSLFDFAAKYGGQFTDWKEARKHYADKAGVKLTGGNAPEDPAESIEFLPWDVGNERLANTWCCCHKKGITLEALKLCGAKVGRYPRYKNKTTGEWETGKFKVIALPCYGEQLLEADPVAWVLWNISGGMLEVFRGKGNPPDLVKMKSVGPTRGTMMGFSALARLSNPCDVPIEWIIKTGGPSDMLAVLSVQRPELRDTHLVLTNASSETGDVLPHQAAIFAGHRAIVIHDCDEAGEMGGRKWVQALTGVAAEVRHSRLPWPVGPKGGADMRDYFRGRPVDQQAAESEAAA
jgi:hypothetical protein